MKVDRQEQEQMRRDRIARAAFELFARAGLDATSAADIARAAFVSRTNLYRYFPSKLHMLLAYFEKTVQASREDAWQRLQAGASAQQIWERIAQRMADLGVRYRHLVGAISQAVLSPHAALTLGPENARRTANLLAALVEPVLIAMQRAGKLRPGTDLGLLSTLLVDACLLSLLHGGGRDQREIMRDWQDRFTLLMSGAVVPGTLILP